jgi:hypothetical protein
MPKTDWRAADVEIIDGHYVRNQNQANAEETIEKIAWLMDKSIPIGGMRIGLDPLLGLLPGVGDIFGAVVSTVLIVHAHRAGVPKPTLLRMIANVGIDSAVGSVPVVGDFFDFAWKANTRNLELYRASIRGQHHPKHDWAFLFLLVIGLAVVVAIPVALAVWAFRSLWAA